MTKPELLTVAFALLVDQLPAQETVLPPCVHFIVAWSPAPTATVGLATETVTKVAAAVTVIGTDPTDPGALPLEAVMVALPALTPVAKPLLMSMEATAELLVNHEVGHDDDDMGSPVWSVYEALYCCCPPTATEAFDGVTTAFVQTGV